MRLFSSGDISGQKPAWYWTNDLHDARITGTEFQDLPYDWTQRNPVRNCLKIYLDASGAMFDTQITCIAFFNCKILADGSDKGGYKKGSLDGCC